ncbi:hypothetical protein B9Z65_2345 [Elsinoe australis]|uniref:Uncharacterized protein n=1 Tax=Elsinoe australis TaxID=40998 RepID=A0A2P7ZAI4_9PEZI|nr:hypothetical protein B9Z65_2345 [Elsinoe australis]
MSFDLPDWELTGGGYLLLVKHKHEYEIAQFCHKDGDPSTAGRTILRFLRKPANITKLIPKLSNSHEAEVRLYRPRKRELELLAYDVKVCKLAAIEKRKHGKERDMTEAEKVQLSQDENTPWLSICPSLSVSVRGPWRRDSLSGRECDRIDAHSSTNEPHIGFDSRGVGMVGEPR